MFEVKRVDRALVAIERHRVPAEILEPEVTVERRLEIRGAPIEPTGQRASSPAS